ncbi:NADP-specific glutamate dehydrogenase [Alteromonas oceanisediminis]|uniref:NADP-specific glutamate dehydrogenase n=1 Tax=Alteromonas oceanisediminis TaxID=2836180 RepID=UPI001BD97EB1|nr:NADP-specific glutamate dehydrogenase [Alteromonas oceanisediminis]MBT0586683.1 NADP-specific glutamate dehydrogenase [Alteromonas oceanisediminis]
MTYTSNWDKFDHWLNTRNQGQDEFIQAVREIAADVQPIINVHEEYKHHRVLYRLAEPDRIITFKVVWQNDNGELRINRGWRVQQSNVLGPYKGGLRFHPTVNESILKFLAFEQCFKNALTGLPLGGGKGGSDFNPKHCSDAEIMRFCQAFMTELNRHVGPQTDVPAGDINVGQREIGYLYGQYRRLANEFGGTITGKPLEFGGSLVREEATGYGVIYFTENVMSAADDKLTDKRINISGAGNVALYAAQKAISHGAIVTTLSNSKGTLHIKEGLESTDLNMIISNKESDNALKDAADEGVGEWLARATPWAIPCDIAMPCATQNEILLQDAQRIIDNKVQYVVEGANMPLSEDAAELLHASDLVYIPGKASNAGGVAMSGFEMSQNAQFEPLSFGVLDQKLKDTMAHIHSQCWEDGFAADSDQVNYSRGANVAAFRRLADAIVAQGY